MTQPLYLKKTLPVAAVAMLQAILPPAATAGMLYAVSMAYRVEFDELLSGLAIIAAALALMVRPQPDAHPVSANNGSGWVIGLRTVVAWMGVAAVLLAIGIVTGLYPRFPVPVLATWAVATPLAIIALSLALDGLMRRVVLTRENVRSAVIAGVNPASRELVKKFRSHPELCTHVHGFFDDRGEERLGPVNEAPLLGNLQRMADYVRQHGIDVIFVALPIRHVQRVMDLLDDLQDSTASVYYLPDIFVFDLIQSRTGEIMGMPVVAMCETPFHGFRGVMKRVTDVVFTLGIFIAALPVMLVLVAIIALTSRGPVIFKQRRYGLDGKQITVYKFRSMYVTEDGGEIQQAQRDDPRVTPIGRILRRYSLDELPQLINVLQGRMSLVGPRPHAVAHNEEYRRLIKGYMIRHKVLPGITGLAQVNGCRGETRTLEDMEKRVAYDLDYLRNWSPLLDFRILVLTVARVFRDRHAY